MVAVTGLFVPKMFRSQERNTNFGQFVPWTIRSLDVSFPGQFVPWTFRSMDDSFRYLAQYTSIVKNYFTNDACRNTAYIGLGVLFL